MKKVLAGVVLFLVVIAAAASIAWRFLTREEAFEFDPSTIRVEVVNGCALPRLGRAIADDLEARGFGVYSVRSATELSERTIVVDLLDPDGGNAYKVARALSVRKRILSLPLGKRVWPEVLARVDSSRFLEVQVVAGQDYRAFFSGLAVLR